MPAKPRQATRSRPDSRPVPPEETAALPAIEDGPFASFDDADRLDDDDCFDTNDRLIDELERILQGDFAETGELPVDADHPLDGGFPLAEAPEEDEEPADEEIAFALAPALGGRPFADELQHELERQQPRRSFWEASEQELPVSPPLADIRGERRALGRFTVITVILMIVAGGAYAFAQLNRDPLVALDGAAVAAEAPDAADAEVPAIETPPPTLETAGVPAETIEPRRVQTVPVTPDGALLGGAAAPETDPNVAGLVALMTPDADPAVAAPAVDEGVGGPLVAEETAAPEAVAAAPEPVATPEPAAAAANAPPGALETLEGPAFDATPAIAGTTTATTTDWVNMRAEPTNGAAVIMTVPAGATVQLVACDPWCEIYYEGTHGWIWQDYVRTP